MTCEKYDKVILDGTNAVFMVEDETEEVLCFGNNQQLDENNTLQGFYNWVQEHIAPQKDKLLTGCFYIGEWVEIIQCDKTPKSEFYLSEIYYEEQELHFNSHVIRNEASILKLSVSFDKQKEGF